MRNGSEMPAPALGAASPQPGTMRLVPQMLTMFGVIKGSPQRTKVLLLGLGLLVVISATAFGQIKLNAWNQPFYNTIAKRDLAGFFTQLTVFGVIAGVLLCLNVAQVWLNQATKIKLRETLVGDLFEQWLKPRRAFRLEDARDFGANPDQRIHEDARHLSELSADLGIGFVQSSLLLGMFIGVLWQLSANVTLHLGGWSFIVPGYMVWCALVYSGAASLLSAVVGRPLIQLNAARYAQEAELRFALMHLNEHIDSISLYGGEADEKYHLTDELKAVLQITWRLANATTRLTWITGGYGWSTLIAPIVIAAPGYFSGDLSFGALMMSVGAFTQVQQSLRWFIDNFSTIADWRATLLRIGSFRAAVIAMDQVGADEPQITFSRTAGAEFSFDNLEIVTPTGSIRLNEPKVEIKAGERVLIIGAQSVGKTIFFRAIAGLWPWGSGRLGLPSAGSVLFISSQPYVPLGTLRSALAYPSAGTAFQDPDLVAALQRSGLDRLSTSLDRIDLWERELEPEEQVRLVVARVLLHKPRFLVTDGTLDPVEEDLRQNVISVLRNELKEMAVIDLGRPETDRRYFARVLYLVKDTQGRSFLPDLGLTSLPNS